LVPTLFFGWFFLWPWMAREVGVGAGALLRQTLFPSFLGCVPAALVLTLLNEHPALHISQVWLQIILHGLAGGSVAALCLWHAALTSSERTALLQRMPLRKKQPAICPTLVPTAD
jgi:hypothetical protein